MIGNLRNYNGTQSTMSPFTKVVASSASSFRQNVEPRVVFFASGDFAIPTLEYLLSHNYNVVGVVTSAKDKVYFHKYKIADLAFDYDVPCYTISKDSDMEDDNFTKWLSELYPDIFCVISFKKLPSKVLRIPTKCAFNVHASQLPFLRGAAPINHAIRLGFKETGLTAFMLNDKIDCGDIIKMVSCEIKEEDDYGTLFERLSSLCRNFVSDLLNYPSKLKSCLKQPNIGVRSNILKAPKVKQEYFKDWDVLDADSVVKLVKSVSPIEGLPVNIMVYNEDNKLVECLRAKIYEVEKVVLDKYCGISSTDRKNYIHVLCDSNEVLSNCEYVTIKKIQLQGKKILDIKEFLRGFKYSRDNKYRFEIWSLD